MGKPGAMGNQWPESDLCSRSRCSRVLLTSFQPPRTMLPRPGGFHITIEAKARGVADPGTHSGYMGSSAHLAGEPVVLRLMDA